MKTVMKLIWLPGIIVLLTMAFLTPEASASLINLEGNITGITLTKNGNIVNLTNADTSKVTVSGTAFYTAPDLSGTESHADSSTGTSPAIDYTTGTFLAEMAGSINGKAMSANLQGVGPYGVSANPGNISETVIDKAVYTGNWTAAPNDTTVNIPYTYNFSLANEPENHFYAVAYTVTAALYFDDTLLDTYTLLEYSLANEDKSPLADIGPVSGSGTITGDFDLHNGKHTFSVVLSATQTGSSAHLPIPPSALLLGSGLLGLGLLGWRRKKS